MLVVDDGERILGSWRRAALERIVVTACDANTARRLATAKRPDLALVGLRLGNTSGIDLIRELKQDVPDLRVVLRSDDRAIAPTAIHAGADLVVFKPITFLKILQQLERTLQRTGS
jgi:DNA-binding NarL/FixJ family response regulator